MKLTSNQEKVLEVLKNYTGVNCLETLYNRIDIILNDCYVGHLAILQEDYNITKEQIINLQNVI